VLWVIGARLQQFERTRLMSGSFNITRALGRALPSPWQVIDGPIGKPRLRKMVGQQVGLGIDSERKAAFESVDDTAVELLPFAP
jgi:hypothetical protein